MSLAAPNLNLLELDEDFLYHLGLTSKDPLPELFGDTKFVCMGGSGMRAEKMATKVSQQLGLPIKRFSREPEKDLTSIEEATRLMEDVIAGKANIREATERIKYFMAVQAGLPTPIGKTERFELYKVGPVVIVSHGMGMPSMNIELDEVTKMLEYAGAQDFEYFRIGTSGGVGIEPGDVVIADEAVNDSLEPIYESTELGKKKRYSTQLDSGLAQELFVLRGNIKAQIAKTMGTDNFYLGQGRLDGSIDPGYTVEEKIAFLQEAYKVGVRNIEMESTAFAAHCLRKGIRGAIVCCGLLDRLKGDQVTSTQEQLAGFSDNAEQVVLNYIHSKLPSEKALAVAA